MLLLLMGLYALGNLATAFTPTFGSLVAFRFISGLPHGAYFGIAAVVASSMVPNDKRAGAVARVMMGLTLAMLLGNPIATFLGQHLGWRSAFALVSVIALFTIALVWQFVPTAMMNNVATRARNCAPSPSRRCGWRCPLALLALRECSAYSATLPRPCWK